MGDPQTRDRALVARDLRDGLITAEQARELYGYTAVPAYRH